MSEKLLKTIYTVLIALLVTSIFLILLSTSTTREELDFNRDENLYYNRTLNYSRVLITCIYNKEPCYRVEALDLTRINKFLNRKFIELLNKRGVEYSELVKTEAYLNISRVNNKLYSISMDLSIIWSGVFKSAEELEMMRIINALEIYIDNRIILEKVIFDLNNSLLILRNTKYSYYIPLDQSQLLNSSLTVLNNLYELLLEYYELMNIIDTHRSDLYNSDGLQYVVKLMVENIDLTKLGELSIKVSNFITQLKTLAESGEALSPGESISLPHTPGVPYD